MYPSEIYNTFTWLVKRADGLAPNPKVRTDNAGNPLVTVAEQGSVKKPAPAPPATPQPPTEVRPAGSGQPAPAPPQASGGAGAGEAPGPAMVTASKYEPDPSKFHPWENPYLEGDNRFYSSRDESRINIKDWIANRMQNPDLDKLYKSDSLPDEARSVFVSRLFPNLGRYKVFHPASLNYLRPSHNSNASNYYTNMHRFAKRKGLLKNYNNRIDSQNLIDMYQRSKYFSAPQVKKASCLLDKILGYNFVLKEANASTPTEPKQKPTGEEAPTPAGDQPAQPAAPAPAPAAPTPAGGQQAPAPAPAAPTPAGDQQAPAGGQPAPAAAPANPTGPMDAYESSVKAYQSLAATPGATPEQISKARSDMEKARVAAVKAQGYGNTTNVDFRRLTGSDRFSSGVNVRGEWLTPAQYTAYKNKEAELMKAKDPKARDNAFAWLKSQLDSASANGQSQRWVTTKRQQKAMDQSRKALAQPRTVDPSAYWRQYGDDVSRIGDKLYVNGTPSKRLMDSARLQDMTVVTRVGPRKYGTQAYNRANSITLQPSTSVSAWNPSSKKPITQKRIDSLGRILGSGDTLRIDRYLRSNASDLNDWLIRNSATPMGTQVASHLYNAFGNGAPVNNRQMLDAVSRLLHLYRGGTYFSGN